MILRLAEHNSIGILGLTLDNATLLEIVCVAARSASLARTAESLLTDEFRNELRRNPIWLDRIADDMRRLVHGSVDTLPAAARVIARLVPLSDRLKDFYAERIGAGGIDQDIGLSVRASLDGGLAYFVEMDAIHVPRRASTMAAARMWAHASLNALLLRLGHLHAQGVLGLRPVLSSGRCLLNVGTLLH